MKLDFLNWLNEAISEGNAERAAELIQSFLTKKVGTKFVRMAGVEEFENSVSSGYGVRFFYDGTKSIRFNWGNTGFDSADLVSIDMWEGESSDPSYNVSFDHEASLVTILPFIADMLGGPIHIGDFVAIPADSLNESDEDIFEKVVDQLKTGEAVPVAGILSTMGSRGEKILNQIRMDYPSLFEKQGRSLVFKGTDKDLEDLKADKDKVVDKVGGVKVQVKKGGSGDKVTTTLPPGVPDGTDIEKIAYEDQLEDLKSLITLTVKGASNALFIAGRGGVGKALANGTLVLTPEGETCIEDLVAGDLVLAQDGSNTTVTGVFPQGTRDTFNVNFSDGRQIQVDSNHLWEVYVEGVSKIMKTSEMLHLIESKSLDRRLSIPLYSPPNINDIELPIEPYVLGALLGDGGLSNPWSIGFTCADKDLLNEFETRLPTSSKLIRGVGIEHRVVAAKYPSKGNKHPLLVNLRDFKLSGVKSGIKFIPEIYKRSSLSQKYDLIAGLLDTDGYIDPTGNVSLTTVSPELARDFQEIIWSIGGKAKCVRGPSSYKKDGVKIICQDHYTITVGFHNPTLLLKLPRKLARLKSQHQYSNVQLPITSIVPAGSTECTCIKIDHPRELFTVKDYICTHNTFTVEDQLAKMGMRDGDGYFKQTGSASAAGIYKLLFQHRKDVVVFDDADGALADQDGRNLIKAATDTKKVRKLAWAKNSKNLVDGADITDAQIDAGMLPSDYEFTGRIIFISNLSIDKLDPDRALRTRALMISIDPTDEEVIDFMRKIVDKIPLEDGNTLDQAEREEVVDLINSSSKQDLNIRKLVRSLNIRASAKAGGLASWERLIKLYA
jgi:hypothetical protein